MTLSSQVTTSGTRVRSSHDQIDTIRRAREAGASMFVAGTAVFGDAAGPAASIRKLLDAAGS